MNKNLIFKHNIIIKISIVNSFNIITHQLSKVKMRSLFLREKLLNVILIQRYLKHG